jgi:hypothetical protein
MSEQGISREMNEVQTWIAGHEATCTERYKEIRQDNADLKAAIERLTRQLVGIKKGLRAEMKSSDAAIEVRIRDVEKDQAANQRKQAYFVGVMAGASFTGSVLGPIILKMLGVL